MSDCFAKQHHRYRDVVLSVGLDYCSNLFRSQPSELFNPFTVEGACAASVLFSSPFVPRHDGGAAARPPPPSRAGGARQNPQRIPPPKTTAPQAGGTMDSICLILESAAAANALPLEFFARVIWQESRFRPDARGPVTRSGDRAQGIAQFMPLHRRRARSARSVDPVAALPKAAEFLRELRAEFGNLGLAAAAYNAGPGGCGACPVNGECRRRRATMCNPSPAARSRNGRRLDARRQGCDRQADVMPSARGIIESSQFLHRRTRTACA